MVPKVDEMRLRADSAFYNKEFVETCEEARIEFTITAAQPIKQHLS